MRERAPPGDGPLAVLPAEQKESLAQALRAAWAPAPLDASIQKRLIEMVLDDPLAPPSSAEHEQAERLRQALEGPETDRPDAALASALKSAYAPTALDGRRERALRDATSPASPKIWLVGALATALAAAATWLVWVSSSRSTETMAPRVAVPHIYLSRSTTPLFDERFEVGAASARLDRIAAERARELRDNRFAVWGLP